MDSLKLPKANSATNSATGSNSNLSCPVSGVAVSGNSAAASPTTTKPPPGMSSTPIAVRFNANEESLDDILQSFHQNKHSPSGGIVMGGGGGGGDASPTLLGSANCMKNNGSMAASLGLNAHGMGGMGGPGNACDSLSSSPSQHQQLQHHQQQQQQHQQQQAAALFGQNEDVVRNNFLPSGFFNRKRSGSIEGTSPTTGGPTLIATLSSGATASGDNSAASVGTWKLIKGKVTQTLEDIKSSKHQQQHQHHSTTNIPIIIADTQSGAAGWTNEPDSDTEGITLNTSISEELPLDQDQKQHNSDSDIEIEILQHDGGGDLSIAGTAAGGSSSAATERSRLRRGLAHIKSKVKAKQQQHHHQHAMHKKDATATPSAPISIRSGFLRRRTNADANEASTSGQPPIDHQVASSKRQSVSAPEIPIASGKAKRGILLARKDVEIESGVEVHEDMIPATDAAAAATTTTTTDSKDGPQRSEPTDSENQRLRSSLDLPFQEATNYSRDPQIPPISSEDSDSNPTLWTAFSMNSIASRYTKNKTVHVLFTPLMLALGFTVLFVMPLHDFLRGVLATVLFIILLESSSPYFYWALEHFVLKTHPERIPFKIPDYTNMPICEIPAVEEHKTIKTYAGWLNETNSYDPNTFSFSLTRSVYVRLDGTILKMSGTNARIPKRRMWNELPIDRTKVLFTDHRSYDLRECRIELLPVGLAKKRYFNRKYPIQLIIKNTCSDNERLPEQSSMHTEVSIKLEAKEAKTALGGGSTPPNTEDPENHIDFGATVMQADLQDLRNSVNPDTELNDITVPCGDEVRLLLFARCDREKEDWYRRFICASKGRVHEQDLQVPQARFVEDTDLQLAAAREAVRLTSGGSKRKRKEGEERQLQINDNSSQTSLHEDGGINTPDANEDAPEEDCTPDVPKEEGFEGMIMSSDVARNPPDYVRFMTVYQFHLLMILSQIESL
ncbi:uncharacterized protein LOC115632999 isoform X2 [Scaptodrosophila lebanonensis]|uniref:Uncharacterized protein LOC115632999 isoform X2 n=1 Tax=Drosophila lebanonensis TaxID=7225 RepID=A0A6J2UFK3_DROLE|nr:uncharacterized protein LOC115632999 isoform X2 [Scaptodrosophila lebanonensis]